METSSPDFDKIFPSFLDLVVEAGMLGLEGIPRILTNIKGEPRTGNDLLQLGLLSSHFYNYLVDVQGNGIPKSEKELVQLWAKKEFLTLRHLIKAMAKAMNEIQSQIIEDVRIKDFVNNQYKAELKSLNMKNSIDDFSSRDAPKEKNQLLKLALEYFYKGIPIQPPPKGQRKGLEWNLYRKLNDVSKSEFRSGIGLSKSKLVDLVKIQEVILKELNPSAIMYSNCQSDIEKVKEKLVQLGQDL